MPGRGLQVQLGWGEQALDLLGGADEVQQPGLANLVDEQAHLLVHMVGQILDGLCPQGRPPGPALW